MKPAPPVTRTFTREGRTRRLPAPRPWPPRRPPGRAEGTSLPGEDARDDSERGPFPARVNSPPSTTNPAPVAQDSVRAPRFATRHQPTAADGEQEEQTDDAASASIWMYRFWTPHSRPGAGNASATTFGALVRVLEIRLEDVDALRSLPPHARTGLSCQILRPMRQHGPLRVCLDSLRRLVAAHPQETHELLERVGADRRHATRDDGNECEGGEEAARRGSKRRRAAIDRTRAPSANPPAAASEPASMRPRAPATSAVVSVRPGAAFARKGFRQPRTRRRSR